MEGGSGRGVGQPDRPAQSLIPFTQQKTPRFGGVFLSALRPGFLITMGSERVSAVVPQINEFIRELRIALKKWFTTASAGLVNTDPISFFGDGDDSISFQFHWGRGYGL
jgi:hypothetical protein